MNVVVIGRGGGYRMLGKGRGEYERYFFSLFDIFKITSEFFFELDGF